MTQQFWQDKQLNEMTSTEWESLCDGCALCCMNKIEDEESGEIFYTAANVHSYDWLPGSCAYRRLANGQDLAPWHPLVSGTPGSVHGAGISLRGQMVPDEDHEDFNIFQLLEESSAFAAPHLRVPQRNAHPRQGGYPPVRGVRTVN